MKIKDVWTCVFLFIKIKNINFINLYLAGANEKFENRVKVVKKQHTFVTFCIGWEKEKRLVLLSSQSPLVKCLSENVYSKRPAATSSATAFPLSSSTSARAKGCTNPGPRPVTTGPSFSTGFPVASAPIIVCSNPG